MHNVLARTAWPSSSYHCASTEGVCQTHESPFQRHQRILQEPGDAGETTTIGLNDCIKKGRVRRREVEKKHIIPTPPPRVQLTTLPLITSSLVLSTSFGSLVRPLLVTVSISQGYTFTKGGIVLLWRMQCKTFAKHNELLKSKARQMHMLRTQPFIYTQRCKQTEC